MRKTRSTTARPPLAIERSTATQPLTAPPSRGRLWYDFQIPDEFFGGLPNISDKVRWVRTHLPRASRVKIGQASCWYETDIQDFITSQREDVRAKRREAV